jgi:hypothetical protein
MKVTFRTVSGESFQQDVEESTTVGTLKSMLEETRSISRDTLRLVYKWVLTLCPMLNCYDCEAS